MLSIDLQDQSQVNTENSDSNSAESITLLSNGKYVITWNTGNLEPNLDFGWYWADVHAQMYNADGTKFGDELMVNSTTYHDQAGSTVIAMNDGGFIVLYQSTTYDPLTIPTQEFVVLGSSVLAQRFDSAGNRVNLLGDPLGGTGEVILAPSGWTPVVAQAADGSFLVAWQTNVGGVSGFQLTYYDEEGDLAATTFHAAPHVDATPQVVLLASGAMLLYNDSLPGQGSNVYGQLFNSLGAAVGGPVLINTFTTGTQISQQVVNTGSGGFITVWASNGQDGSSYGIYGQAFDSAGTRIGVEFRVNTTTVGSQSVPDITALDNGNLAVVWQSNGQDGSSWGAYLQVIDSSGNLVGGEIQIADETVGSQSQAKVTSDGDTIFVTWSGADGEGDTNLFTRNFEISAPADDNANVMTGDELANFIDGQGGNDLINGLGGKDTLTGGAGNDSLNGGDGNDVLNAGAGDMVDGGEGSDRLILDLASQTDPVFAGANPNGYSVTWGTLGLVAMGIEAVTLTTGNGNDTVNGLDGNDIINTGNGFDRVYGGGGADYINVGIGGSIVWHAANQTAGLAVEDNAVDTIIGGMGGDIIYVGLGDTADGGGQPVNIIDRVFVSFFGSASALNLDLSTGDAFATLGTAAGGTYSNFEEIGVFGSVFADSIVGTAGSDRIFDLAPFDGAGGNDTFLGGAGNDFLSAGSGANVMDGGDGNDVIYNTSFESETLIGGADNDTVFYGSSAPVDIIGNGADNVDGGAGLDLLDYSKLVTGVAVNLSVVTEQKTGFNLLTVTGVENVIGSADNDNLTGNDEVNALTGAAGNDLLDGAGGLGIDSLTGGLGNDTFIIRGGDMALGDDGDDLFRIMDLNGEDIDLTGGAGFDTIDASLATAGVNAALDGDDDFDVFLGSAFNDAYDTSGTTVSLQRTLRGGDGDDALTGGLGNDALYGDKGNDRLDGGADTDTATGGVGDDTYVVNSTSDVVIELTDQGTDTVETSVSLTIATNFENLTLTGSANLNGTGNTRNNVLTGNSGANILSGGVGLDTLIGGLGNDQMDGGEGADSLTGGMGNDVYNVENLSDVIVELLDQGIDTVKTNINGYTLGSDLENLTLSGSGNINGNGNALNNTILGNAGRNILQGGAGDDILGGGVGADTLIGGDGSDTYVVDNVADLVTELLDAGLQDTIKTDLLNYVLIASIENLTLTGSGNANATGNTSNNILIGNTGNNALVGGKGDDNLQGGGGDDVLNGGTGSDRMNGGLGNDTYWFGSGDRIDEPSDGGAVDGGIDTVMSTVRDYNLASNLEHLTLFGDGALNGTGNAKNNIMTGNALNNILQGGDGNDSITGLAGVDTLGGGRGNDVINGGDGNDVLFGGEGADLLTGGSGNDIYLYQKLVESPSSARDTITDLSSTDIIDLSRIDANVFVTGDQAFHQVLAFTGQREEMVLTYDAGTNRTLLTADANGDKIADFALIILGNHTDITGWLL